MPNLKDRLDRGDLVASEYRCGLPSQTTVVVGGLLYGEMLAGNQYYDKTAGRVVDTMGFEDADQVDEYLGRNGTGLLSGGGKAFVAPLQGGAEGKDSYFALSDIAAVKEADGGRGVALQTGRELAELSLELALHPLAAVRSGARFVAGMAGELRHRKKTGHSLSTMVMDSAKKSLISDGAAYKMAREIRNGTPSLYVDFPHFDGYSHTWGPGEKAFHSLKAVDRNLDVLLDAVEESDRPYNVVLVSDHGQVYSHSFAELYGTSLEGLAGRLAPGSDVLSLDFGSGAHLYLKDQPGQLGRSALPPGLVRGLVEHEGIAFVLTREGNATFIEGSRGSVKVTAEGTEVTGDNPLAPFGNDVELLARQMHGMASHPQAGDLIVMGDFHDNGMIDFSTRGFGGLHGGIGGGQDRPFLLFSPGAGLDPSTVEDAADLHHQLANLLP